MTALVKPLCSEVSPYFQLNDCPSFNKIWVSYVNSTELVSGQVPMPSWLLLKPTLRQPKGALGVLLPFRSEQNITSLWIPWPQSLSSYFQSFHLFSNFVEDMRAEDGERLSQEESHEGICSFLISYKSHSLLPSPSLLLQRNWQYLPPFLLRSILPSDILGVGPSTFSAFVEETAHFIRDVLVYLMYLPHYIDNNLIHIFRTLCTF